MTRKLLSKSAIKNLSELTAWSKSFAGQYVNFKTLVLLEGDLGAGKTEFVKQLATVLGMKAVSSPTYAVLQMYSNSQINLHHVDLYRLKDQQDLESTGFWDLFDDDGSMVCVEWANMIPIEDYPFNWKRLHLKIVKEGDTRILELSQLV